VGRAGERVAARHLESRGYRILDRNWKCRIGEIDIVGWQDGTVVFVEVKSSLRLGMIAPEERVRYRKQKKLRSLARAYMQRGYQGHPVRFDVISVWWQDGKPELRHIEDAF
jgi:putative endonuclease